MGTNPDIDVIRAAIVELPGQCRYHGQNLDPFDAMHEACCDTGRPALRRRKAMAALKRIAREVPGEH